MQKSGLLRIPALPALFLLASASLWSCAEQARGFVDVTSEAGIDFLYNFGDTTYVNILESSGSGITVFDYDGDGQMDIYMMNGTFLEGISSDDGRIYKDSPNKLYRNLGRGRFEECGEAAGVDDRQWSMAAGAIDYDDDGDQDLFLLNYGPNVFYRNNGDGSFSDITASTGLHGPDSLNGFPKWSVAVSWLDVNKDGLLDAFVGNFLAFDPDYVSPITPTMMPHPSEYKGQASLLYEQQADGSFLEHTAERGLYFPDSKCMGLAVWDFDRDGDPDLFQGNDHQANFLFRNDEGNFTNIAVEAGVAVNSHGTPTGSMHAAMGDVDGDGHIDLLVPDLRYGALYRNRGDGSFEDITERSGISAYFNGKGQWSTLLFDYDNDGDLDVLAANGIAEELILSEPLLLENDGKGNFTDVGKQLSGYFAHPRSGRAAATIDYDNDGDLDLLISHIDLEATPALLQNNCSQGRHWLGLQLQAKEGCAHAIGATVTVHRPEGDLVRINQWTTSYLSSSDPRLHFGLGNSSTIDSISVAWIDGNREVFPGPDCDQYLTLTEGMGRIL